MRISDWSSDVCSSDLADGSFQNNHTATAQQWDAQFPSRGLAMAPFADRLPSVLKDDVANGLVPVRARGKHPLTNMPQTPEQAWGCIAEYLSGTAKWEQWRSEEHTSELQSLMRISYAVFCLKKKKKKHIETQIQKQ